MVVDILIENRIKFSILQAQTKKYPESGTGISMKKI
jgi:hypothetical protein